MFLFDAVNKMLFGKRKNRDDIVETDVLGKISHPKKAVSRKQGIVDKKDSLGKEISLIDLQQSIDLQKEQIKKLKDSIKEHEKYFPEYEKSKKHLNENKKTFDDRRREYLQIAKQSNLAPKQKQELKESLREIDKYLLEFKKNERENEKFIDRVNTVIKDSKKAIRINEKALVQNEKALKLAKKSDGAVRISARDIGELEQQFERKDLPLENSQKPSDPVPLDFLGKEPSSETTPAEKISSPKMKDEDYWSKGFMK